MIAIFIAKATIYHGIAVAAVIFFTRFEQIYASVSVATGKGFTFHLHTIAGTRGKRGQLGIKKWGQLKRIACS